ncbi:MAG: class I SAM-dependent methyltransferase [Anaerolineales bacterium]|nr:class I SAM-dependent methyltransferase [Anaerolineales bacterium]
MTDNLTPPEKNNQELWDELAPVHFEAYREIETLRQGGVCLDEIELADLGDVRGLSLLHLQCHIGADTLSWARLGARVTGVDFSEQSLALARELAEELGLEATFVHSNLYDLRQNLEGQFDIVYTSRGVLVWLRDIAAWAQIIAHYLKPGGVFYVMEMHPFFQVFEEPAEGRLEVSLPYFHSAEPTVWDDDYPDYADEEYTPQRPSYEWQWPLSDILNALIGAGLQIQSFHEYERLFFKLFAGMEELRPGWYKYPGYEGRLPLIFTLKAAKPR